MTLTDFLRIILKITGIYFLVIVISNTLPSLLIFMNNMPWVSILLSVLVITFFVAIFLSLVFKPDFYIKSLKLDKGFDNNILSIKSIEFKNLIKLAIITIGIFLIIKQLPIVITHLIFLLKLFIKNKNDFSSQIEYSVLTDYLGWGIKIISFIIGYLMITNNSAIAEFIIRKDSQKQRLQQ